ncbi:MAG TPA: MATE family efflux transporter [Synechococcales cyanobacterium M55_K2018_004]|nr:MATE family efflux transporter [Synechococcales cyanobacterium M55_K2018_004]
MPWKFHQLAMLKEVKACLKLAVPLAGAQLVQAATSFVDTMMMGWLGSQTIAAGGLGATSFAALLLSSSAMVSAVSPLSAQAFGAGDAQAAGQAVRQGLWLALLLSLPIMLLLWHGGTVLQHLGQSVETATLAEQYLRAIATGFFPGLGFAALRSFVAALSRTRPIILVIAGGTLLNMIGNYVLMFGKLGFPALGLAGIGYASSFSLWCMLLTLGLYLLSQPNLRQYQIFRRLYQFEGRMFWTLVKLGVPLGVLAVMETGLFTVTTYLMGQLGTTALAAHQIAIQVASLTFMVPLGISLATTVRVGQLVGRKSLPQARMSGFVGIGLGGLAMLGLGLVIWVIPEPIVGIFLDLKSAENTDVIQLAVQLLKVAALFQLFDGIQVCAVGALHGIKDTVIPMVIGIVSYWGIGLTAGYWLGLRLGFGGVGLWCGLAIALCVAALVLTWRFATAPLVKLA